MELNHDFFSKKYRQMPDDELIRLYAGNDLTDIAMQALQNELTSRNINDAELRATQYRKAINKIMAVESAELAKHRKSTESFHKIKLFSCFLLIFSGLICAGIDKSFKSPETKGMIFVGILGIAYVYLKKFLSAIYLALIDPRHK